jgi:hypothetical protein
MYSLVYGWNLRGWKGRGEQREFLYPLCWSAHHNLSRNVYIESTCCYVQASFLAMESKILFTLLVW